MKQTVLLVATLFSSTFLLANPIETEISIRNTHSSYVNRGMCSIKFDVTAYDSIQNVQEIGFKYLIKDKSGKILDVGSETVSDFNRVGGRAYGELFIEGEKACELFGETIEFIESKVIYDDGTLPEDIVKNKKLIADDFVPMKIIIK